MFDAFANGLKAQRKIVPFDFIHSYHNDPLYIQALANSIDVKPDELLLFSFHGIPKRYETEGDFYAKHCQETAELVAEKLGLPRENGICLSSPVLVMKSGYSLIPIKPLKASHKKG